MKETIEAFRAAATEAGLTMRYDEAFGHLRAFHQGTRCLELWHDADRDRWLKASLDADGVRWTGTLTAADQRASGLRTASSRHLSDLGGMGVATFPTPLAAAGGLDGLRDIAWTCQQADNDD